MAIFKFVCLIFFILVLVVLEISFPLIPKGVCLIFVLMVIFLIEAVKKKTWLRYAWLTAVFGGVLLDCYSIFPPGLFFLSLGLTAYISAKFLLPRFNLNSSLSVLIASLIVGLVYQVLILVIGYSFYFLNLSDLKISFNGFYCLNIFQSIILNSLLIIAFYLILKLIGFKCKRMWNKT